MRVRVVNPLELLVDVLACYRLVRLVTADTITGPLRWRVIRWSYLRAGHDADLVPLGPNLDGMVDDDLHQAQMEHELPPKLATLMRCRWCAGVWIAGGVTAARWLEPGLWNPVGYGLAIAAVAVLLAGLEE